MINTKNLIKVFRTDEVETTALNNVNLDINKGEFVAIMGPSGCGPFFNRNRKNSDKQRNQSFSLFVRWNKWRP